MGSNSSKVTKLRKKKSRQKQSSNESSYSSKSSFSEEASFESFDILPEDLTTEYEMAIARIWGMEYYSAPVDDILTTTGKILEAGCGNGSWLINLSRIYPIAEYIGVDLNPVTNVNYPHNVTIIKGDLLSLPYDENQFDFAKMSNFSCYLTDNEWVQGISEMIRVTKCGSWVEFWEVEPILSKNAPTYMYFVESYNEYLTLSGITGVSVTKLEYFLYSSRKLDNIQCSSKSMVIGQKGGEDGIILLKCFSQWFLELHCESLSKYMGISQEEYRRRCKIMLDEIEQTKVELIFRRFWAQKKMNPGVD
ncbi:4014_t:CDS:2 [Acaulospora morrowiae]|uniref:4014_t:CDS:1 n=1 Tax=Acaulospora morrowiae TaxID=94023 RepID=A0A9N9DDL1_9GLOM|nr:4014_t:CDS:2 [Acaulospora morrowiae]